MKAQFPLKPLLTAVAAVASIVPSRTTKDILKNIKFSLSKDSCALSAMDSETSIVHYLRGVECTLPGDTLLPCDKLLQILREASGESVSIDVVNGVANIAIGRAKFKIPTEDADKFPPQIEFTETAFRTIKVADMRKIVKRCVCTSPNEKCAAFAGVHFEITDKLRAISCDAKCLSMAEVDFQTEGVIADTKTQTIVPAKAIKAVGQSIPDEGMVDFVATDSAIKFRSGDCIITSPLVQGRYPNWKRVVPQSCNIKIDIPAAQFASTLRQSMITTAEETHCVEFLFDKGTLTLKSQGKGSSVVDMPIPFDGQEKIYIDPSFVLNGLSLVDKSAVVTFGMNDADSPILLTCEDGLKWVAMPANKDE